MGYKFIVGVFILLVERGLVVFINTTFKKMVKCIFFDLFFTLCPFEYLDEKEYEILGITCNEWEKKIDEKKIYTNRILGEEKNIYQIIRQMLVSVGCNGNNEILLAKVLDIRKRRLYKTLVQVDDNICQTLLELKKYTKLCLISNADILDKSCWECSPLKDIFDYAIFSCDIGMMKPNPTIYRYACTKMDVKPSEAIYVGDGGDNELLGAKAIGMYTVQTTQFLKNNVNLNSVDKSISKITELLEVVK
ncbi:MULTISPECIES: HAD family hydrolase [Blautia]|uniref:HAD family hydrolase n=1 Tax=Blautia TaxID=572511 RepID=UPI0011C7DFC5|nr:MULTISPECIES: HAD family hydrolase [Blautia]